jgi:hypothetical protein
MDGRIEASEKRRWRKLVFVSVEDIVLSLAENG